LILWTKLLLWDTLRIPHREQEQLTLHGTHTSSLLSWLLMESKLCVFVSIKYLGFERTSYWRLFQKHALRTKLDIYVLIIIVLSTSLYFYSDLRDYQFFISSVDFIKSELNTFPAIYHGKKILLHLWKQYPLHVQINIYILTG
jgi:hypothetical protein